MASKDLTEAEHNVESIRKGVYQYKRDSEFPNCGKHSLPQVLTCATKKCNHAFQALCV